MQSRSGFASHPENRGGPKLRARSEKFFEHFSQATLFFDSQSPPEQDHLVEALRFELGKVERPHIRERMIGLLGFVSQELATRVAEGFGLAEIPRVARPINHHFPADRPPARFESKSGRKPVERSAALSMADTVKDTVRSRRISILVADGVDAQSLRVVRERLLAEGALPVLVAPRLGFVVDSGGDRHWVEQSLLTGSSVLFDAVYVPGGSAELVDERDALAWICEAYRHCKAIAVSGSGVEMLAGCPGVVEAASQRTGNGGPPVFADGLLVSEEPASDRFAAAFVAAIAQHRFWERKGKNRVTDASGDADTRGVGRSAPVAPPMQRAADL
jgi:catalase